LSEVGTKAGSFKEELPSPDVMRLPQWGACRFGGGFVAESFRGLVILLNEDRLGRRSRSDRMKS
jgi:hypothetical protein